jgi:hypothetical protein
LFVQVRREVAGEGQQQDAQTSGVSWSKRALGVAGREKGRARSELMKGDARGTSPEMIFVDGGCCHKLWAENIEFTAFRKSRATNSGANWPRQPKMLLRVWLKSSNFWRSRVLIADITP